MANILMYTVEPYRDEHYIALGGVYNDFKLKAEMEYKFELQPLEYEDFVKCVKDGLLECLVLTEDGIPTAFLVYTTVISESLELNIIHTVGEESIGHKRRLLMEKFLEINNDIVKNKVIVYPMLGKQAEFVREITHYGFKLVGLSVVKFSLSSIGSIKILKELSIPQLHHPFSVTDWSEVYFNKAVDIIHNAFKDKSDALFDTRFKSINGTIDIVEKITNGTYGRFLPAETKILLYRDKPVGLCFANLTNDNIANIPLIAVDKKYRSRGYSKLLLKNCVENIVNSAFNQGWSLHEINASADTENYQAIKMYRSIGFKEDYTYPQAYRPIH